MAVQRIKKPDRATFLGYLWDRKPVVIVDLFDGMPLSELTSEKAAIEVLGNLKLDIKQNYTTPTDGFVGTMSFSDYLDYVTSNPTTKVMALEQETPADVLSLFDLPAVCQARPEDEEEIFGWPRIYGEHDLVTNMFVGNQSNFSSLHFDGDHRHVLLTQVLGRKHVYLLPHSSEVVLAAESDSNVSKLRLHSMSQAERSDLVERGGGVMCILEPGETLFIPALMWHFVYYETFCMSFNLRFGRNRFGRFLGADNFYQDIFVQSLGTRLLDEADVAENRLDLVEAVAAEFQKPSPDPLEKYRRLSQMFQSIYEETPNQAVATIPQSAAATSFGHGSLYADFTIVEGMRQSLRGEITPRQSQRISSKRQQCGFTDSSWQRILFNRLGKSEQTPLTRGEGAILLQLLSRELTRL